MDKCVCVFGLNKKHEKIDSYKQTTQTIKTITADLCVQELNEGDLYHRIHICEYFSEQLIWTQTLYTTLECTFIYAGENIHRFLKNWMCGPHF